MNAQSPRTLFELSAPTPYQRMDNQSHEPRLKKPKRDQFIFQTVNVERLVSDDHPVRAIWEFVERLNLSLFYEAIQAVEGTAGRSAIDPQTLISLWIYAYSRGISSAREISTLCEYDPAFGWLTGMQIINHHTLSDFRIEHKEALDELFAEVLGLLSAENLITLETVMHDGTKIRASAGVDSFRREDKIRAHLEMAEELILRMGNPLEQPSSQGIQKAGQRAAHDRKEKLELALKELEKVRDQKPNQKARQEASVSQTDPQARIMKQADGGYRPSYNVQISTDHAHGLIVGIKPTQETNDCHQLLPAIDTIEHNTGHYPKTLVADGGYTHRENILAMDKKGVDFMGSLPDCSNIAASQLQKRGIDPKFNHDAFRHDQTQNVLICPAGKFLEHKGTYEKNIGVVESRYQARAADCTACSFRDQCCPRSFSRGRSVAHRLNHPVVESFILKMHTPQAKEIYRKRGPTAEFPNAWIKEKMGLRQFRLRGILKVGMECLWAALTYNIQRWIQLIWRTPKASGAIA